MIGRGVLTGTTGTKPLYIPGPFAERSAVTFHRFEKVITEGSEGQKRELPVMLWRSKSPAHPRPADVIRISIEEDPMVMTSLYTSLDLRDQTLTADAMVPFAKDAVRIKSESDRKDFIDRLNRMMELPISPNQRLVVMQSLIEGFEPFAFYQDSRVELFGYSSGIGERFNDLIATLGKWKNSLTVEQRVQLVAISQRRFDQREISFDDAYRLATVLTYNMTEKEIVAYQQRDPENSLFFFITDGGPAIEQIYFEYQDRGIDSSYIEHLEGLADAYRYGKVLKNPNDLEESAAAYMAMDLTKELIITGEYPEIPTSDPLGTITPAYHRKVYGSAYIDESFSFYIGEHKIEVFPLVPGEHSDIYRILIDGRVEGKVKLKHNEYDLKYPELKMSNHTMTVSKPNYYTRVHNNRETDRMKKMGLQDIQANAELGIDEASLQEGIFLGFQGMLKRQFTRNENYHFVEIKMGNSTVNMHGPYPNIPQNRELPLTKDRKPESFTFYERDNSGKLVKAKHQLPPRDYYGRSWQS